MNVTQTDKTDQTGMRSTTPMSSNTLLNSDGNAGSDERNDNSGNGTNTGIENQRYSLLERCRYGRDYPQICQTQEMGIRNWIKQSSSDFFLLL